LRGSASRLHPFTGLEEIEETLTGLLSHEGEPMVVRLPRQPGQKEVRFAHLLSGEPEIEASPIGERPVTATPRRIEQRETLEQKVDRLTEEVEKLRAQFEEFKKQFE